MDDDEIEMTLYRASVAVETAHEEYVAAIRTAAAAGWNIIRIAEAVGEGQGRPFVPVSRSRESIRRLLLKE